LVAEPRHGRGEALTFPTWCRILELVRIAFAACGGEEVPLAKIQKGGGAARIKTAKEPVKNIGSNHIL